MVDARRSSADGNGGVGGSGGGKRRSSSSPPPSPGSPTKRSKAEVQAEVKAEGDAETEKSEEEVPAAAAAGEEEAGTSLRSAVAAGKRPAPLNVQNTLPPAATGLQAVEPQQPGTWARLVSQSNQISHVLIFGTEFSVGRSETCNIFLKDHNASRVLCKLWLLEQPSGCCQLNVTGKKGLVELNGSEIKKGGIGLLVEGDEVAFCKHAFIFQPFNTSATLPPCGSQIFKDGLKQGILGPDAIQFTLEDFPYYLSPNTKSVLLSAAFIHMEKKIIHMEKKLIKGLSGISSLNQRILLSGPSGSEIYQETLIKALAKNFGARLLIIDSLLLPVNELHPDSYGDQEVETLGIGELIEVMWEESISSPLIVLVKDVEKALTRRTESHASLRKELPPGVLIIGSHTEKDSPTDKPRTTGLSLPGLQAIADMLSGSSGSILQARNKDATNSMKHLNNIFPKRISIELPKDEAQLSELKKQLRIDAESFRAKSNASNIHETAEEKAEQTTNDEDRYSDESQRRAWRSMPSISVRSCFATVGAAGERLQACSAFLGRCLRPLTDVSEFLLRVATYAPNSTLLGDSPSALTRIARGCGEIGTFLGHAATTVQGVTGMGQMLGAGFCGVARICVPEVVPETEPEPEPTSQPTKITISTVEQVDEVIKWTAGGVVAGVEVDVSPDVTPSMAVNIYNQFRTHGSNALALISGGHNMMAKRAIHFAERNV